MTTRNVRRHSRTALRPSRGHIFRVSTYTLGLANGLYLAPLTAMIYHSGALRGIRLVFKRVLGTLSTPLVARTRKPTTKFYMNAHRLVPPFGGPQQKPRYGPLAELEDQQSCKPRETTRKVLICVAALVEQLTYLNEAKLAHSRQLN